MGFHAQPSLHTAPLPLSPLNHFIRKALLDISLRLERCTYAICTQELTANINYLRKNQFEQLKKNSLS